MGYLFTSESVSEGHPDKVADQISDALLDEFLKHDPKSKVACETMVTTGLVVVSGEVKTTGYVDVQEVARKVINKIGYTKASYMFDGNSCGIISALHEQSSDIRQGVEKINEEEQGAGDQGMMFGYACKETDDFMPLTSDLSHILLQELSDIRKNTKLMPYLRPDSKSQVTLEYNDNNQPKRIHTIVVSTQHDDFDSEAEMLKKIYDDVEKILIPRAKEKLPERVQKLFDGKHKLLVNPTGKFVIGGPHGDTGLTGRKIIVDTYGGKASHGGGAFSGKDSSKVDRSAAYAARHIAKNLVAAGVADEILIQVSYAIGVPWPINIYVNSFNTSKTEMQDHEIAEAVKSFYDMRPFSIVKRFGLGNPVFEETASYGHFGRDYRKESVEVYYKDADTQEKIIDGEKKYFKTVEFFAWEKLDLVDDIKRIFKL